MRELFLMAAEGDHKLFVITCSLLLGILWWYLDNRKRK